MGPGAAVLQVEPAQVALPQGADEALAGVRGRGPQPHRGAAAAPVAGQADEGAADDGQLGAVRVVLPGEGLADEPLVHAVPRGGGQRAVPGERAVLHDGGIVPGCRVAAPDGLAMPGWAAGRPGGPFRRRAVEGPAGPHPGDQDHGQAGQQEGEADRVVAGVQGDESPLSTASQGSPAPVAFPPPVHAAEQPPRARLRLRPQPVRHVRRQPDPPVRPGRQGQPRQRPSQPRELHAAGVQRAVQRPCPRPNSGTSDSRASSLTRPSAHKTASARQNSISPRRDKHRRKSARNLASSPVSGAAGPRPAPGPIARARLHMRAWHSRPFPS